MDARTVTTDDLLAQGRWVRALARSLVGDPNAADDVEQQAWLEAIERPPRHGGNLRAWFARVVRRRALDRRRGEGRRRRREADAVRRDGGPAADEVIVRAETRARIAKEVLALEEPYRAAVLLRWFEEMSPADVAAHLGVPLATVRTRLARGLARLRERLQRGDGGEGPVSRAALVAICGAGPTAVAAGAAGGLVVATQSKLAVAAVAVLLIGGGGYVAFHEGGEPSGEAPERAAPAESYGARAPAALEGAPAAAPARGDDAGRASEAPAGGPAESANVRRGEPAGPGVVAGTVHDEAGAPIAGAEVLVWNEIGNSVIRRDRTAADGTFRFADVPAGRRPLSIHASENSAASAHVEAGGASVDVTLRPPPPGPLGPPAPTIAGVVVDDAERPVAGVRIEATSDGPQQGVVVSTAEDGTFDLRGLGSGPWTLLVGVFAGWTEGPTAEFLPLRVGPVEASAERLRVVLARGREISGVVHAPGGGPWTDGASVTLYPVSDAQVVDFSRARNTRTAADGTFRVAGLPTGAYRLRAETAAGGEVAGGFAYLPRVTAGTVGLVVRLERGVPLAGKLVDQDGNSVRGEGWVWVAEAGAEPGGPGSVQAKVLGDGRFETPPLDEGKRYRIRASGFAGCAYGDAEGLRPGDPEIVVRLSCGGELVGEVLDREGRRVAVGVPVALLREPTGPGDMPATAATQTDAEGRFRVGGLAKGTWYVEAGGGMTGWVSSRGAKAVDPHGQSVTLTVTPGAKLSGRLVDARGEPLASVVVEARADSSRVTASARTEADGRFSFRGVPGRAVRLFARIGDRHVDLGRFDVPAEDVTVRAP